MKNPVSFKKSAATMAAISVIILTASCDPYRKEPDFQGSLNPSTNYKQDPYASSSQWPPFAEVYTQRFVWKMRYIADQLASRVKGNGQDRVTALMTTITPVDNIQKPTSFGRLITEQLMTEMDKAGFRVVEARKTADYNVVENQGEFALSRDVKRIGAEFAADAVVVGTFSRSKDQVLINVRLVGIKDSSVLASASAMMDIRGDKFLAAIIDEDAAGGASMTGDIAIRKKVLPEVDPYSDVLHGMLKTMAGRVAETASASGVGKSGSVAVATFVDINHMYKAATFGRYVGEQMINELSGLGFRVMELRATPDILVDVRLGEMGLSREAHRLMQNSGADAVLVGTYTKAGETVVVSGRLVFPKNRQVVGVGDILVDASPKNKFITALLEREVTTITPAETVEGY
ncbi:MAG: hypothetical protein HY751_12080 [Nitrospinae bacterium]|nr:hypothetical protein [Nitrospinota bacterium]